MEQWKWADGRKKNHWRRVFSRSALSAALSWISFALVRYIRRDLLFAYFSPTEQAASGLIISPFRFFVHWSTIAHQLSTPVIDPSILVSFFFCRRRFSFSFFFGGRERENYDWKDVLGKDRSNDETENLRKICIYREREFVILFISFSLSFPLALSREYLEIEEEETVKLSARFHHFREIKGGKERGDRSKTCSSCFCWWNRDEGTKRWKMGRNRSRFVTDSWRRMSVCRPGKRAFPPSNREVNEEIVEQ